MIYGYHFPNNAWYIGQTWNKIQRDSYHRADNNHNSKFQNHINKYGLPKQTIIFSGISTQSEMDRLEQLCINRYAARTSNGGLNAKDGGNYGRWDDSARQAASDANKRRWDTEERIKHGQIIKQMHVDDPSIGQRISESHKALVSMGIHPLQGKNEYTHNNATDITRHAWLNAELIKKWYDAGWSCRWLGEVFNISGVTILKIIKSVDNDTNPDVSVQMELF